MEAFSLLKYWRGGGGSAANVRTNPAPTTISAAVSGPMIETDIDDDDEGPFFDLEFTVPVDEDGDDGADDDDSEDEEGEEGSDETDEEKEFDFTVSSTNSGSRSDPNLPLSPSDDLFFKGRLVPLEPSSLVFNPSEPNSKAQFPVSFLKSATKFRVFLLGFKKPKAMAETNAAAASSVKKQQQQQQQMSKFFTVKFKVEEVPIVSLLTRDNSSRSSVGKTQKQPQAEDIASEDGTDARKFSKDVVQKYLKMIKPLYVRVSRRYGEKLRFSGQLRLGKTTAMTTNDGVGEGEKELPPPVSGANVKYQKQVGLPSGLRVVCKHLGKSRSSSAAVAPNPLQPQRRDDSLLQQQDGIQSAIAHCKRSLNASSKESEVSLPRSSSDPLAEKSARICEKGKEACI